MKGKTRLESGLLQGEMDTSQEKPGKGSLGAKANEKSNYKESIVTNADDSFVTGPMKQLRNVLRMHLHT